VTPTKNSADYGQLSTSRSIKSGRATFAILGQATSHVVCPSRGIVHLGHHQQQVDQVLLRDLAAGPLVHLRSGGHHHLSTGARPFHTLKIELVRRLSPSNNAAVSSLHSKWATASHPSFSDTSGASPQMYQMTFSTASGPTVYLPMHRPFLPASPWETYMPWLTAQTASSRLHPSRHS
jgi:hypothetical protein